MQFIEHVLYRGCGKLIFDRDFFKGTIVNTEPPTTVFLLDRQHERREWASSRPYQPRAQHLIYLFFDFGLLEISVTVWPYIDKLSSLFKCDTMANVACRVQLCWFLE